MARVKEERRKRPKLVERPCPGCGQLRICDEGSVMRCEKCLNELRRENRLDTRCRKARNPSCINCAEDAIREYLLPPPTRGRTDKPGRKRWCVLCQKCIEHWIEKGEHRFVMSTGMPAVGSPDRPLTSEEIADIGAARSLSRDATTDLLTIEWRR